MAMAAHVEMQVTGGATVVAALTAMGGQLCAIARRVALTFLAHQYGAPGRLDDDTPWHEIGSDSCRILMLIEVEDRWGIQIGDDDREALQTFGDLFALVSRKVEEPA